MAALILDDRRILNKKYPALANFPFNDFDLEIGELPIITKPTQVQLPEDTKPSKYDSPIIRFTLDKVTKFSINIHERDLLWILDRAETISQLDIISQVVNEGMESENILKKRDSVEIADNWIKMLSDGKTMLTYSTFTEVLSALIGEQTISDTTHLINNINNLANKRGLVKLSQAEYKVVMTYYQFRLIYTKLILGLVIAAKISL